MSEYEVPEFDDDLALKFTVRFEQSERWPGKILAERWFNRHGDKDSVPGRPTEIVYDPETGNKVFESFYSTGYLNSPNRHTPAIRVWSAKTQRLIREEFFFVGDRHRANQLPAVIDYDPISGEITNMEFYIEGRKVAPPENALELVP